MVRTDLCHEVSQCLFGRVEGKESAKEVSTSSSLSDDGHGSL
jgi:hypothetical protein